MLILSKSDAPYAPQLSIVATQKVHRPACLEIPFKYGPVGGLALVADHIFKRVQSKLAGKELEAYFRNQKSISEVPATQVC